MIVRNVVGARTSVRVALFSAAIALAAVVGCGGEEQTTGTQVGANPEVAKQQSEMEKFYAKNPLPKPKPNH